MGLIRLLGLCLFVRGCVLGAAIIDWRCPSPSGVISRWVHFGGPMYSRHHADLGYLSGICPVFPYYGLGRAVKQHTAVGVDARIIVFLFFILALDAVDFGELDTRLRLAFF